MKAAQFYRNRPLTSWPWDEAVFSNSIEDVPSGRIFWPCDRPENVPAEACDVLGIRRLRVIWSWDLSASEVRSPTATLAGDITIEAGTRVHRDDQADPPISLVLGTPMTAEQMIPSRGTGWDFVKAGGTESFPVWSAFHREIWNESEFDDADDETVHIYRLTLALAWRGPRVARRESQIGWTPTHGSDFFAIGAGVVVFASYSEVLPEGGGGVGHETSSTSYEALRFLGPDGLVASEFNGPPHAELHCSIEVPATGGRW